MHYLLLSRYNINSTLSVRIVVFHIVSIDISRKAMEMLRYRSDLANMQPLTLKAIDIHDNRELIIIFFVLAYGLDV